MKKKEANFFASKFKWNTRKRFTFMCSSRLKTVLALVLLKNNFTIMSFGTIQTQRITRLISLNEFTKCFRQTYDSV